MSFPDPLLTDVTDRAVLHNQLVGANQPPDAAVDHDLTTEPTEDKFSQEERTPEQRKAYSALHGNGGLASWQRIIRSASPEK